MRQARRSSSRAPSSCGGKRQQQRLRCNPPPTCVEALLGAGEQRLVVVVHQQAVLVACRAVHEQYMQYTWPGWQCSARRTLAGLLVAQQALASYSAAAANCTAGAGPPNPIGPPARPPARPPSAQGSTGGSPPTRSHPRTAEIFVSHPPVSGPSCAHWSTLTMRGTSLRRSREGVPSNSRLLFRKRCARARAAWLSTCDEGQEGGRGRRQARGRKVQAGQRGDQRQRGPAWGVCVWRLGCRSVHAITSVHGRQMGGRCV